MKRAQAKSSRSSGFTLAEVMVALVVVGITSLLILQGLGTAKLTAAHTHNRKVARELAMLTLSQLEAGLFWEELETGDEFLSGTYAEEGYEAFHWFLTLGDESLPDYEEPDSGYHDSYAYRRWQDSQAEDDDEEDEEATEPYERVTIRVEFPKLSDLKAEITLERWVPWEQIYGASEEEQAPEETTP